MHKFVSRCFKIPWHTQPIEEDILCETEVIRKKILSYSYDQIKCQEFAQYKRPEKATYLRFFNG